MICGGCKTEIFLSLCYKYLSLVIRDIKRIGRRKKGERNVECWEEEGQIIASLSLHWGVWWDKQAVIAEHGTYSKSFFLHGFKHLFVQTVRGKC